MQRFWCAHGQVYQCFAYTTYTLDAISGTRTELQDHASMNRREKETKHSYTDWWRFTSSTESPDVCAEHSVNNEILNLYDTAQFVRTI